MGFFSDLKDDLSQAVNELAPEDGLQAVQDGANAAEDMDAVQPDSIPTPDDLSDMLDKMEALATESVVEEPVMEPTK